MGPILESGKSAEATKIFEHDRESPNCLEQIVRRNLIFKNVTVRVIGRRKKKTLIMQWQKAYQNYVLELYAKQNLQICDIYTVSRFPRRVLKVPAGVFL